MTPTASSSYLEFVRVQPPERKTPIVVVRSKSSGMDLGMIAWFGRWRQFCFYPAPQTIFNVACMTDIQDKIAELQEERRAARQGEIRETSTGPESVSAPMLGRCSRETIDRAARQPEPCGRMMVGSGTDTYDPVCELPKGHTGRCKSSAAVSTFEQP